MTDRAREAAATRLTSRALDAYLHGDQERALRLYARALDADPTYASAWRGIGVVQAARGNAGDARAALERYLELAPRGADAGSIRARVDQLALAPEAGRSSR